MTRQNEVAILRYHAIVEQKDNFYASPSICLSPELFEEQVQYFSKNHTVISLDEVYSCIADQRPFPEGAVVFTFDDGYRDNYNAAKILRKYGVTGTFYIAANCIDYEEPLWLFEVIYLVNRTNRVLLELVVNNTKSKFNLKNTNDRALVIREITSLIKSNTLVVRESIRDQIREQLNDVLDIDDQTKKVMLSWKQVCEMGEWGMDIGGHTLTHLNLPNAEAVDADREIIGCKKLIESKLNKVVNHFSYPNGGNYNYYNPAIMEMVKKAGYLTATTSNNGLAPLSSNPLELYRIRVTDHLAEIIYQITAEPLISSILGR